MLRNSLETACNCARHYQIYTLGHIVGLFILLLVVMPRFACAQDKPVLQVGDVAPEISISGYLQAPERAPTTLSGLKGKAVVIDFWASWCPGCVGSIDHVNALVEQFEDRPVVFIALVNEPERTIRLSLEKRPMQSWVAIDQEGTTTDTYRISGYPQSVLITPEGRIAAFVNPNDITPDAIDALLENKPVALPHQYFVRTGASADPEWDEKVTVKGDVHTVSQALLRRSQAQNTVFRYLPTPGQILGDGVSLAVLLQHAYDVSDHTFDNRLPRAGDVYQVSIVAPVADHKRARRLLRGLLEQSFSYTTRWETRTTEVVVLRKLPDVQSENFQPADGDLGGGAGRMGFHLTAVPMKFIAETLGGLVFKKPVLDETGLQGTYNLDVDWELDNPESTIEALRTVGLAATIENRDLRVLVVEPK